MKSLKFDRLNTDAKIIAFAEIKEYVTTLLEFEEVVVDINHKDIYQKIFDEKVAIAIRNYRYTEKGKIIEESITPDKGILDYGKEFM
jgi:hypothetical protein